MNRNREKKSVAGSGRKMEEELRGALPKTVGVVGSVSVGTTRSSVDRGGPSTSVSNKKSCTYMELYTAWLDNDAKTYSKMVTFFKDFLKEKFDGESWTQEELDKVQKAICHFSLYLRRNWTKCNRDDAEFRKRNASWLIKDFELPFYNGASSTSKAFSVRDIQEAMPSIPSTSQLERPEATAASPFKNEEFLALVLDARLTQAQYETMYKVTKGFNCNMCPCYRNIIDEMKNCHPENIKVTKTRAEIELQALLNHTAKRLIKNKKIQAIPLTDNMKNFRIYYKWGFNHSSAHPWPDPNTPQAIQKKDLYIFSLLLMRFHCDNNSETKLLWQNPRPSSVRYCRPMKFFFEPESTAITIREINSVENYIKKLLPTKVSFQGKDFNVTHVLNFIPLVDEMVYCTTKHPDLQKCLICQIPLHQATEIDKLKKIKVTSDTPDFAFSTLFIWIRFLECFLDLAYRIEMKSKVTVDNRVHFESRKKEIRKKILASHGVDVGKVSKTRQKLEDFIIAKKFFKCGQKIRAITGIDVGLIIRVRIILSALSSGHNINYDVFDMFCISTAKLIQKLYPWFTLPLTVHSLLVHGSEILKSCLLPIGVMSEGVRELLYKYFSSTFEGEEREEMVCREIMQNLCVSSDPYLSSIRVYSKLVDKLEKEVRALLIIPDEILKRAGQKEETDSDYEIDTFF